MLDPIAKARAELDARDFGCGFLVRGERVAPQDVVVFHRRVVSLTQPEVEKLAAALSVDASGLAAMLDRLKIAHDWMPF